MLSLTAIRACPYARPFTGGSGMKKVVVAWWLVCSVAWAWASPPVPLLWKVSNEANSLYLLGSFHMLAASDYPLAPSVDQAFAAAQQVYFEVAPEEMNGPQVAAQMMQMALPADGKTLPQTLSPKGWATLQHYAEQNHVALADMARYKPWFVAILLAMGEAPAAGLDPALGLDKYLMDRAAQAAKPTHGLETAEAQITTLDGLSLPLQEAFLLDALREMKDYPHLMGELHSAWHRGDVAALEHMAQDQMRAQSPELYQRVNASRNQAWLPTLDAVLQGPAGSSAMVVVGALHLVGRDGLVQMLKHKGYRVERLR